jgi:hypothetical protein
MTPFFVVDALRDLNTLASLKVVTEIRIRECHQSILSSLDAADAACFRHFRDDVEYMRCIVESLFKLLGASTASDNDILTTYIRSITVRYNTKCTTFVEPYCLRLLPTLPLVVRIVAFLSTMYPEKIIASYRCTVAGIKAAILKTTCVICLNSLQNFIMRFIERICQPIMVNSDYFTTFKPLPTESRCVHAVTLDIKPREIVLSGFYCHQVKLFFDLLQTRFDVMQPKCKTSSLCYCRFATVMWRVLCTEFTIEVKQFLIPSGILADQDFYMPAALPLESPKKKQKTSANTLFPARYVFPRESCTTDYPEELQDVKLYFQQHDLCGTWVRHRLIRPFCKKQRMLRGAARDTGRCHFQHTSAVVSYPTVFAFRKLSERALEIQYDPDGVKLTH